MVILRELNGEESDSSLEVLPGPPADWESFRRTAGSQPAGEVLRGSSAAAAVPAILGEYRARVQGVQNP